MFEELNMELNINKYELFSEKEEDSVTDLVTGIRLHSTKIAKYLGQTINNQGETINIINTFNYGSITGMIKK